MLCKRHHINELLLLLTIFAILQNVILKSSNKHDDLFVVRCLRLAICYGQDEGFRFKCSAGDLMVDGSTVGSPLWS